MCVRSMVRTRTVRRNCFFICAIGGRSVSLSLLPLSLHQMSPNGSINKTVCDKSQRLSLLSPTAILAPALFSFIAPLPPLSLRRINGQRRPFFSSTAMSLVREEKKEKEAFVRLFSFRPNLSRMRGR